MKKRKDLFLTVHERYVIADLLNQLYYNAKPTADFHVHLNFYLDADNYGDLVDLRFKFLSDLQKNE